MIVSTPKIVALLQRSRQFEEVLIENLDPETYQLYEASDRLSTSLDACHVALEHSSAVRLLFDAGHPSAAAAMVRLQFEALVRAVWLLHAASDAHVGAFAAPLTVGTVQSTKNIAGVNDMVGAIDRSATTPPHLKALLIDFKNRNWQQLNSFVHAGLQPMRRVVSGHLEGFAVDLIEISNNLLHMTAAQMATLTGNQRMVSQVLALYAMFPDCLQLRRN